MITNPPKPTVAPDSFALICFLVLMENGDGLIDKSSTYISEKTWMLRAGLDAFSALDYHNMRKVKRWCDKWRVDMPLTARKRLIEEENALVELKKQGLNFGQ